MKELVLQATAGKGDKYDPLVLRSDRSIPEARAGECVVKVAAAALNHRDLFIRQGLYPKIISGIRYSC